MNSILPPQSWKLAAESDTRIVGTVLGVLAIVGIVVYYFLS